MTYDPNASTDGYGTGGYDPGGIDQIPADIAAADQGWHLRLIAAFSLGLVIASLLRRRRGIAQPSAGAVVMGLADFALVIAAVALALTPHKVLGLPLQTVEILFWPGVGLLVLASRALRKPEARRPRGPAMPAPPPSAGGLPYPSPSPSGPVQPQQPFQPAPFYDRDAALEQSQIRLQRFRRAVPEPARP